MQNRSFTNRGQALVMVALGSLALFAMMGLAVDFGWSFYVRKQARSAADAAALAEKAGERRREGDTALARGDGAAALQALHGELDLRRRLCELAPDDAEMRRAAAQTAARIAELLVFRSAVANLRRDGRRAAASATPDTRESMRQREVAWTLRSVGDTLEAQGDVAGALALYREGLDVRRQLAAREPDNADLLLDITFSLAAIAQALVAQGDLAGAQASLAEALAIRRDLVAREPAHPRRRLDLSWSLMAMADILEARGEHDATLAVLRESLAIRRALLAGDRDNDGLCCDVAASLARIGDVHAARGDRLGAYDAFVEARDMVRALIGRATGGPEQHADLAALEERIAAVAVPG